MRKKALLAGATSAFEGPWVSLEAGEWLVEPSPDIKLELGKNREVFSTNTPSPIFSEEYCTGLGIRGPIRVRAVVSPDYSGPGIFLVAKQVSNGANS